MGGSRGKSKTQRGTAGPRAGAHPSSPGFPSRALDTHTGRAGGPLAGKRLGQKQVQRARQRMAGGALQPCTVWAVEGLSRGCRLVCPVLAGPGQSLQGLAAAYLQVQEALQRAWRWMHHSELWCGAVPGQPYTRQGNGSQGRHNGGHEGETDSARLQPGNKYIITALSNFASFPSRQRPSPRADIANPRCEWSRPMSPDKTACVGRKPGLDPAPAAESRFPKGTCGRPRKL